MEATLKLKEEAHGEVKGELMAAEVREKQLQQQLQVSQGYVMCGGGR